VKTSGQWTRLARSSARWLVCLMLISTTSCASIGGDFCRVMSGPIVTSEADVLTIDTKRQIVAVNRKGEQLCDW